MLFHFQINGCVHVHRHGFDLSALRSDLFEERAYGQAAVAQANPQNTGAIGIHGHRRITMAFMQGELIHHQATHITRLKGAECSLYMPFVQRLDGVPVADLHE